MAEFILEQELDRHIGEYIGFTINNVNRDGKLISPAEGSYRIIGFRRVYDLQDGMDIDIGQGQERKIGIYLTDMSRLDQVLSRRTVTVCKKSSYLGAHAQNDEIEVSLNFPMEYNGLEIDGFLGPQLDVLDVVKKAIDNGFKLEFFEEDMFTSSKRIPLNQSEREAFLRALDEQTSAEVSDSE